MKPLLHTSIASALVLMALPATSLAGELTTYADGSDPGTCAAPVTLPRVGGLLSTATLTGAPDYAGYSFNIAACAGTSVTGTFSNPPPALLTKKVVVYIGGADVESGDVYYSTDGTTFSSLGSIDPPVPDPYDPTGWISKFYAVEFDVTVTSTIKAVKVTSTQTTFDGLEIDAFGLVSDEEIGIDIKPGSDPNCFNINGHGVVPVAILGAMDFDVTQIDPTTLKFGGLDVRVRGNKGPMCSYEYSDADAYLDMVCQFEDDSSAWEPGTGEATLTGKLFDGTPFQGTDTICVVP